MQDRGIVLEKAMNEVRYWLKENSKKLEEDDIELAAKEALELFVEHNYSSLEAAVENIMENYNFNIES